jgi:hypothetical protein
MSHHSAESYLQNFKKSELYDHQPSWCSHKLTKIYTSRSGKNIWIGKKFNCEGIEDFLKIDCSILYSSEKIKFTENKIEIRWPNFSIPEIGKKEWLAIFLKLRENNAFFCAMGHGRSGTACSIILCMFGMPPWEAISTVRKNHCIKCVESASQVQYVYDMYNSFKCKTCKYFNGIDVETQGFSCYCKGSQNETS